MKKSIQIVTKHANNKIKNQNQLNSPRNVNKNNNYFTNNSSISSITSPSISRKTLESNKILSPIEHKNKKKKNLDNYKAKTMQTFSPDNKNKNKNNIISENAKNIKKNILGKNKENEITEKTQKNIKNKKDSNNSSNNNNIIINNNNNNNNNNYNNINNNTNINNININNNNNISNNFRKNTSPLMKHIQNQKIKNKETKEKEKEKEKEIPGLKELDKDIMKEYNINKNDELINRDINLDESIFDKSNEFNYFKIYNEEELTPFQKKEKIIKKLLKTKNYQKFVKKLLQSEPILYNQNGELIEFNLFNKDLYNYEFLDIYYKHNIPYIIMRPRLDVIKRKREAKQKKEKEEQEKDDIEKESENGNEKESEKILLRNSEFNESQLTSLLDKSSSDVNTPNIIKLDRKELLFPSQDGKAQVPFVLTKMPQKTEENTQNRRLNIAFNKAKDAARVVRRLEYSYSMRINILLSKPIYQKKAKVIQKWWKDVTFAKKNIDQVFKLQAYIRGTMIRKAFREVKHTYLYKLPFLREIDRIISRRKLKIYFDKLVAKYGILKLLNKTKPHIDKVRYSLQSFKNRKKFLRENHLLFCPKKNKCCYTKEIFDWETKLKLYKAQAAVKFYLMHHNEKIIKEQYANKYNPKLFYMLKYGNNKEKLKRKLKNFRNAFLKFKELKLKATLPGNISNKFLFFKYILRKKIFNTLLNYYSDSLNNKDQKYQQNMKMKILLNHLKSKQDKDKLKKYFMKWNLKAKFLKEYYNILILDKLYVLEAIFRYQKKYREKVFMLLLNNNKPDKKEQQMETAHKIYDLYNRRNGFEYENNLLRRILYIWKKKAYQSKIDDAAKTINLHAKKFLDKLHKNKLDALLKCFNIRNKVFKEKLKLWKFNTRKLNHHFNFFKKKTLSIIKTKEKLDCLRKNFNSLLKRQKEKLRKYFNRFKTNTGVRKLVLINVQLCFFDENKEIISRDKYSMMKYVRNMNYVDIDKIKKDIVLKKNFDFWKIEKKASGLKRLCGKRISDLCTRAFYLEKLKFLHWHKIVQQLKYDKASRLIQKNYHLYKEGKKKKDNINDNNNEIQEDNQDNEQNTKKKRWKRYDRTIKNEDEKE